MSEKSKVGAKPKLESTILVDAFDDEGNKIKKPVTLRERILAVVRGGNFPLVAARACGVAESTWYGWLKDKPDLAADVKAAEYEAEAVAVGRIAAAAADPKFWTANAWFLERKHGARWGQTIKVQQQVTSELEAALVKIKARLENAQVDGKVFEEILNDLSDEPGSEEAAGEGKGDPAVH